MRRDRSNELRNSRCEQTGSRILQQFRPSLLLILLPPLLRQIRNLQLLRRTVDVWCHQPKASNRTESFLPRNRIRCRNAVARLAHLRSDWRRPRQLVSFQCPKLCAGSRHLRRGIPGHLGSGKHRSRAAQREAMGWRWRRTAAVIEIGRATSELQSPDHLVCRLLLEKKKKKTKK